MVDRGWLNNKGISANYTCSVLMQWNETPHLDHDATLSVWFLISYSNLLVEIATSVNIFNNQLNA
jgi:hypothetical protein